MYCRNCGSKLQDEKNCSNCNTSPLEEKNYCQACGHRTNQKYGICPHCHQQLKYVEKQPLKIRKKSEPKKLEPKDEPDVLANIFAFLFPLVHGIIFFIIWRQEKPIKAKSVFEYMIYGILLYIFILFISWLFLIW